MIDALLIMAGAFLGCWLAFGSLKRYIDERVDNLMPPPKPVCHGTPVSAQDMAERDCPACTFEPTCFDAMLMKEKRDYWASMEEVMKPRRDWAKILESRKKGNDGGGP